MPREAARAPDELSGAAGFILRPVLWLAVAATVALLLGCGGSSGDDPYSAPADTPNAHVAADGWRVELRGAAGSESTLSIDPEVPDRALGSAEELSQVKGVEVGDPVSIELEGGRFPVGGAVLTRRLKRPLPRGSVGALSYYDERRDAWLAAPTRVSADRRTLTARVFHFSILADIHYEVASLLSSRVDAPSCKGPRPTWIDGENDVVVLDDKNAPLRWCAGRDPRRPDVLVVKVAMNRPYGVRLVPEIEPEWTYDGLFQSGPDGFLADAALRLSEAFGRPAPRPGETILLGGEEVHYGFTAEQVRSLDGPALVKARLTGPEVFGGFTYTALSEFVEDEGRVGRQAAAVAALLRIAQCESGIGAPLSRGDYRSAAEGGFDCLKNNSEDVGRAVARGLAEALPEANPKALGKIGGKVGGKLWQVWAVGNLFDGATLVADKQLPSIAFELHAFPEPIPPPDLSHAELTPEGFGPVHIGMTAREVRKLGIRLKISRSQFCDSWTLPGVEDLQLFVPHTTGRLAHAGIYEYSRHAPRGVQPGDSVDDLEAAFGGELEVIPLDSLDRDFYRVYSPDRASTMQFSVDRPTGEITYIEVGEPGNFYYPDGMELCA